MTWQFAYAAFGAPLLIATFGLAMFAAHRALDRRDRRLYDDQGYPRIQGGEGRH